jgi:hypothetical protein
VFKLPPSIVQFARLCVYLLYCLEAGGVLMLAPWTDFWANNAIIQSSQLTETLLGSVLVRGCVSGVGMALVVNALADVYAAIFVARPAGSS